MKRFAFALALLSSLAVGVRPAAAGEWNYQQAYPVGYPAPYQQQQNREVLKKVLIGGALVGIGFLAGRLSAPKPNYGHGYGSHNGGPQFQPGIGQPTFYRGSHGQHHRF